MDNTNANAKINPPAVPDDFQFKGTAAQILRQILDVVAQSTLSGVAQSDATTLDVAQIQQQITTLNSQVEKIDKKVLYFRVDAVHNGIVTIPFGADQMPSTNYSVQVNYIGDNSTAANLDWYVIDGSKTINQVQVKTTGAVTAYDIEVKIQEN